MKLFRLFHKQKGKSCRRCQHFRFEGQHIDFEESEYVTIHESSCMIYGRFKTFHSGNFKNKIVDEMPAYEMMLAEKGSQCPEFDGTT